MVLQLKKSRLEHNSSCHYNFSDLLQNCLCGHNVTRLYDDRLHDIAESILVQHLCMMASSNGNIFRVTGHLCGEFTCPRWIPHTKASDAELWCFCDLRLDKRLRKQSWGWWLETPLGPLWRHCNGKKVTEIHVELRHHGPSQIVPVTSSCIWWNRTIHW